MPKTLSLTLKINKYIWNIEIQSCIYLYLYKILLCVYFLVLVKNFMFNFTAVKIRYIYIYIYIYMYIINNLIEYSTTMNALIILGKIVITINYLYMK